MNTENSQEEIKTPRFNIGDLVYTIFNATLDCANDDVFVQTAVIGVVYGRKNGRSYFIGYQLAAEGISSLTKESAVYATKDEAEAAFVQIEATAANKKEEE